jgi:DNA-binding IclR family transcriptional regulator
MVARQEASSQIGSATSVDTPEPARVAASIRSVERAVSVLRLFLPGPTSLALTDIAALSGLSMSTVHRYCSALRRTGLLRYDPDSGQFSLGSGCIELGLAAAESLPVVEFARTILADLVRRVDRTVVLGVWDEYAVRVVDVNDKTSSLVRVTVRVGSQLDLFDSAQGMIYLACSPRVHRRFARHPKLEPLQNVLAETRQNGFAILTARPGSKSGMRTRTAAAPVYVGGEVAATIAMVAPVDGEFDALDPRLVADLCDAAQRLSARLTSQS